MTGKDHKAKRETIREEYLKEHPWCESGIHDISAKATEVVHIFSYMSEYDPLFFSSNNLQALCDKCYKSKLKALESGKKTLG